ncbi:hypothetical protein LPJ61_006590, partial [Coemansia biformis]
MVTMHAYALSCYIFLTELASNKAFDPGIYLNDTFFREAWTSLTDMKKRVAVKAQAARDLVNKYVGTYKEAAGLDKPIEFPCAGQVAMYEAIKMVAAYKTNISLWFGDSLRCAINLLLDVKQATANLSAAMSVAGHSKQEIQQACYERYRKPAGLVKVALGSRIPDLSSFSPEVCLAVQPLVRGVHMSYALEYEFDLESIYYDIRTEPIKHFRAFCCLSRIIAEAGGKSVQCQPMRTSWVPSNIHIDKWILVQHLLDAQVSNKGDMGHEATKERWQQLLDMDNKIFKNQGGRRFCGAIETDGVSLSVIKKTKAAEESKRGRQKVKAPERPKHKCKCKRSKQRHNKDFQHIDQIP